MSTSLCSSRALDHQTMLLPQTTPQSSAREEVHPLDQEMPSLALRSVIAVKAVQYCVGNAQTKVTAW